MLGECDGTGGEIVAHAHTHTHKHTHTGKVHGGRVGDQSSLYKYTFLFIYFRFFFHTQAKVMGQVGRQWRMSTLYRGFFEQAIFFLDFFLCGEIMARVCLEAWLLGGGYILKRPHDYIVTFLVTFLSDFFSNCARTLTFENVAHGYRVPGGFRADPAHNRYFFF